MRLLFWNMNRRGLPTNVAHLAWQENADVLILAECGATSAELLVALNDPVQQTAAERTPQYQFAPGNCGHLLFFTRFDSNYLTKVTETHRISIRKLKIPTLPQAQGRLLYPTDGEKDGAPAPSSDRRTIPGLGQRETWGTHGHELLIAAAHLPSKQDLSEESQVFEAVHFARLIEDAEKHCGHQRTVVIGDLNMNPFEAGMVAASGGLHAVGSRRVAERERRTVHQRPYGFFYNPMWAHFGDRGETAGTYYYESGEPLCYFWNLFDQVLLRPALLDGFSHEQVRIVTTIGTASLLRDGCPDKEYVSDHLPVVVEVQ